MKLVTVSEAKSRLSEFIKSAENGEKVVIMRGSKPAVLLSPVTEENFDLVPEISASALASFESEVALERKAGRLTKIGGDSVEAIARLRASRRKRK